MVTDNQQKNRGSLRVSVVMPSYNHARFIGEAIDSVLSQDYPLIDLLVMDGGSSDRTVEILKSYGDKLSFVSQKDRGQSDAINQGLARANGDIVCWLNSDDMFAPGAITAVVRAFNENPDADFIYGNGWAIDEAGNMMGDSGVLPFDLWKLIHQRCFIQQPSCFFRKSLLEKVGMIDESLHFVMDWELWIRFAAYKGLFIKEFLSYNRTYDQNKTQSGHFRRWREIYRVVRKYTNAAWPPILTVYLIEIIIQVMRSRKCPSVFVRPLLSVYDRYMRAEMSGRYPDGSVKRVFRFSAGNPLKQQNVRISFLPASSVDKARLGEKPFPVYWKTTRGDKGYFKVLENGLAQEFLLAVPRASSDVFVHFACTSAWEGQMREDDLSNPPRMIIGYLNAAHTASDNDSGNIKSKIKDNLNFIDIDKSFCSETLSFSIDGDKNKLTYHQKCKFENVIAKITGKSNKIMCNQSVVKDVAFDIAGDSNLIIMQENCLFNG